MTLGVEQNIVWLHIAMNDTLGMDIPQGTAQLSNPEADRILRKAFPGDMESKIAAIHEIDNDIAA